MMKKHIKNILSMVIMTIILFSCADEDKDRFQFGAPGDDAGVFTTIDFDGPTFFDVENITGSSITFTLDARSNNVASHSFKVRRVSNGTSSEFFEVVNVNSFPSTVSVTPVDIANAIGIDASEILAGDRFDFLGESLGSDGSTVVTFNSLDSDLSSEVGQKQAYKFESFVSCPYVRDDLIGTYETVDVGFFTAGSTFEVVAGVEDNQIMLIGAYETGYDFIIEVENSGLAELPIDRSVDPANEDGQQFFDSNPIAGTGPGVFAPTRMVGNGFVFSCTGLITFTNNSSILLRNSDGARFSWTNDPNLVAQKIN